MQCVGCHREKNFHRYCPDENFSTVLLCAGGICGKTAHWGHCGSLCTGAGVLMQRYRDTECSTLHTVHRTPTPCHEESHHVRDSIQTLLHSTILYTLHYTWKGKREKQFLEHARIVSPRGCVCCLSLCSRGVVIVCVFVCVCMYTFVCQRRMWGSVDCFPPVLVAFLSPLLFT